MAKETVGRDVKGTATDTIKVIESYEKEYQKWERRGEAIVKRYRDDLTGDMVGLAKAGIERTAVFKAQRV